MELETITDKQGICLLILFLLGTSLLIGTASAAKQDAWIAIILGFLFSIPAVLVYARLLYLFANKNLFQIVKIVFGNTIGNILIILYVIFSIHLGSLILRNYSEYTNVLIFPDTPTIIPLASFILLCVFGVKMGIEVLGRWAEFSIWSIMILIVSVMILLSLPMIDINNLRPSLYYGIKPILSAGFGVFSFPFAESIIFTMCFSSFKKRESPYKIYLVGLSIGFIILLLITLRNLLIAGPQMINIFYFPSFTAVSIIKLGEFIQRLELAVSIILLINVFAKFSLCLIAAAKGICNLFNFKNYRFFVTPCATIMLVFSMILFKNTLEMEEWAVKVWPYYAFIFEAILPVLIIIFAEIKVRKIGSTDTIK